MGTIGLSVFKVISGSFGALVSIWPVTRQKLAVEQNGVQFEARGSFYIYMGYL